MTEPVAKFANKLPGIKSKARASELPDLVLLDQIHAKKKDAHHAEMKKLTENINELTIGREKAEQEVSKMRSEMSRMEGEMEGRMESLMQQLEEAKEAQGLLEAYVRQLVNRLLEVGSLTG
jgi:glutamyl-tRNA reductase